MELMTRGLTDIARSARAAGCEEAADLIWQLVGLLDELVDYRDCQFASDGYCRKHYHSSPCPHARAKDVLAKRDDGATAERIHVAR